MATKKVKKKTIFIPLATHPLVGSLEWLSQILHHIPAIAYKRNSKQGKPVQICISSKKLKYIQFLLQFKISVPLCLHPPPKNKQKQKQNKNKTHTHLPTGLK